MFKQARIKLTLWYLLIIMLISTLFSLAVYRGLILELGRSLRVQTFRIFPELGDTPLRFSFNEEIFNEVKQKITFRLILVNSGILIVSGFASYFLAGRTLKPIEEMVEEQKRFIADASHELRTPLTAMKTEIEVNLRDKKLNLKEAKNLLNSNLEEVEKIQALSNYLLALSRYENQNLQLSFDKMKLSEVIQKAQEKVQILADKKKITIKNEGDEIEMDADFLSLTELVTILLDNAVKYSYEGGEIVIKTSTDRYHAVISVQDFGIGIKASDIPYIFNRFYRADNSRSKMHIDGYGLGLSIAKSIVEKYNGSITVESTINKGSKFTVKLPRNS